MANTPHQPPGPPPKEPPKPGAQATVPPHPSTTVTAAATHADNPHAPYTQAAVYKPTKTDDVPAKEDNPEQYKTPKDFHLAKQGSRDYVAGQPVDEEELKKVDEDHDKKVDEATKAAKEAKAKSEALQKGSDQPHPTNNPPKK